MKNFYYSVAYEDGSFTNSKKFCVKESATIMDVKKCISRQTKELNVEKMSIFQDLQHFQRYKTISNLEGKFGCQFRKGLLVNPIDSGDILNITATQDKPLIVLAQKASKNIKLMENQNQPERLSVSLNSMNSLTLSDIHYSFEKNARIQIQKELFLCFRIPFKAYATEDKKLDDETVFGMLQGFAPGKASKEGQVDVYFGICNQENWVAHQQARDGLTVLGGNFADSAISLNKSNPREQQSPTSNFLPETFYYYCIFEATTRKNLDEKLVQLETQLQYVLARSFLRLKKQFPSKEVAEATDKTRKRVYQVFVGAEIVNLVAFTGLIVQKDITAKEAIGMMKSINRNNGQTFPCLHKLLKEKRFLCCQGKTFGERLENLEKFKVLFDQSLKENAAQIEDLKVHLDCRLKENTEQMDNRLKENTEQIEGLKALLDEVLQRLPNNTGEV